MESISSTLEVSKLDKSNDVKLEQREKVFLVLFNSFVLKFEIFNDNKL